MLDISGNDRKVLYTVQRGLTYVQGQVNSMSDQYMDDSAEAEAVSNVGVTIQQVLVALDDILMPD